MIKRAKELTEDLLEVVRAEHEKARLLLFHQQHELQMVQGQYGYNVSLSTRLFPSPAVC